MSETALSWDEIDANDEEISEGEQAASDDISFTAIIGKFLCTVTEVVPEEKTFNAYSCHAAGLSLRIEEVIELEQPLLDDKGKQVKRNDEPVFQVQPVTPEKMKDLEATIIGAVLKDEINLFHPKEKAAMKKRRLFVAKKLGILGAKETQLPSSAWPTKALGKTVVVISGWNYWKDKATKQQVYNGDGTPKRTAKVEWDGYETAPAGSMLDSDLDSEPEVGGGDTSFKPGEFDDI